MTAATTFPFTRFALATFAACAVALPAAAQTAAPAKPAAKTAVPKAAARKAAPPKAAAKPEMIIPEAYPEQVKAADMVFYGKYDCDSTRPSTSPRARSTRPT